MNAERILDLPRKTKWHQMPGTVFGDKTDGSVYWARCYDFEYRYHRGALIFEARFEICKTAPMPRPRWMPAFMCPKNMQCWHFKTRFTWSVEDPEKVIENLMDQGLKESMVFKSSMLKTLVAPAVAEAKQLYWDVRPKILGIPCEVKKRAA